MLRDTRQRLIDEAKAVPQWEQQGWPRPPRNGREKKQLRAGKPCPHPRIEPCKQCGGSDFSLQPSALRKDGTRRLIRYCLACRRQAQRRYRQRNLEKVRERNRKYMERYRAFGPIGENLQEIDDE